MNNDNTKLYVVPLSNGQTTIIDIEDIELTDAQWHAHKMGGLTYAARNYGVNRPGPMHRQIMERILGRPLARLEIIDHKDNNPLNNTRGNLRLCTQAQNCANQKMKRTNKCGFKGVSFHKYSNLWRAQIWVNKTSITLGYFKTPEQAHEAYKDAAIKYFGEFARWE